MTSKCTPKNTYFWHPESDIEEHHQYAFVGASNNRFNIPIDEKALVAIRGKVVSYNKEVHKTGLKVLLDSDLQSFIPKKHEWCHTVRFENTAIFSVFIATFLYGIFEGISMGNHKGDTDLGKQDDKNKDLATLLLIACMSGYIFSNLLILQSFPTIVRPYQNLSYYLGQRYWKVMKLDQKPSPAERLFHKAMQPIRTPTNSLFSRIVNYFAFSSLQHPTLRRAMTDQERDTFLGFLMNASEDNMPLDPYTFQPIDSKDLWVSTTVTVNKGIYSLKQLLYFIFIKGSQGDGKIPHPYEERAMNDDEREAFFEDLATVFCVNKEMIRGCWKRNPKALFLWAEEILKKSHSNWDTMPPLQKAFLIKSVSLPIAHFLPAKLLNLLPTYRHLEQDLGVNIKANL